MAGSSPLTITVDASAAIKALGDLSGPGMQAKLSAGLREAALFAERAVAEATPVDTGALRASVKASPTGTMAWRITSPLTYAPIVEAGSRPHVIRPRRARVLAFRAGSGMVFTRRVMHPGTRAARMFAQGADKLRSALPDILRRHVRPGA